MKSKKIAIVGSGPGAAVVCNNLMQEDTEITVFEKGDYFQQKDLEPYSIAEIDKKYEGGGTTAIFGSSVVNYGAGSCLGGGSEVNAGLYYRTPSEKIRHWGKYLNGLEKDIFSEDVFQNIENLLSVQLSKAETPASSKRFAEGALKMGLVSEEIPRWVKFKKTDKGIATFRQSMTEVFWKHTLDAIKIKLRAKVTKLEPKLNGIDITWIENQNTFTENFDFVFLCGGAISTPYLLMLSRLMKNNYSNRFSYHPTIRVLAKFPENISDPYLLVPSHQIKLPEKEIGLGVSIVTEKLIKMNMVGSGFCPDEIYNEHEKFGLYYCMTTSEDGYICKLPFLREPLPISFKQKGVNNRLFEGISILEKILVQAGAIKVRLVGTNEDLKQKTNAKIKQVKSAEKMTIHLMSSCPLGAKISPIDKFGTLKKDSRILIADSSIIPSVLGVNPQGTVMALANFVSKKFIERDLL